jgi:hypothetical protein
MDINAAFQAVNVLALIGWIALLASPWIPAWSDRIAALIISPALAIAYTGLVMAFWSSAEGGFDTLDNVIALFKTREVVLAGWIHYLAFDLFVGAWEVRTARREEIPFWLVVPCLVLTFLFGPAGFLLFSVIRAVRPAASASAA